MRLVANFEDKRQFFGGQKRGRVSKRLNLFSHQNTFLVKKTTNGFDTHIPY